MYALFCISQTLRAVGGCDAIESCLAECAPCSPNGFTEGESTRLDRQITKLGNALKQASKKQPDPDSDSETPPVTPVPLARPLGPIVQAGIPQPQSRRIQLPPLPENSNGSLVAA